MTSPFIDQVIIILITSSKMENQKKIFTTSYEHVKETLERLYFKKVKLNFEMPLLKTIFAQVFKLELMLFANKTSTNTAFRFQFVVHFITIFLVRVDPNDSLHAFVTATNRSDTIFWFK